MKNFTLLLLLITAVTFTGCKKDSDGKAADNIVGKWYTKSSVYTVSMNGQVKQSETNTDFDDSDYTEFKSNGTAVDGDGEEYTYKVTSSKLTMREKGNDKDEVFDIKKISSTELILYKESSQSDGSDTYKVFSETTFKKK